MTLRKAYDSTTAADLPTDGAVYLAYVDGRYANYTQVKARFPRKPVVRITVTGRTFDADMADVESGDLSPASAAVWAKGKLARKEYPVLYFPESSRGAVVNALRANGVDPAKVGMFPAQYDGKATLNHPGDMGKQYASSDVPAGQPGHTNGHKDVSVVRPYWPGVDPKPAPAPRPWFTRTLRRGMTGRDVIALKQRLKAHGYRGFTVWVPLFGAGCERAVRAFQKAHHLTVDGVVGPFTAKALG